VRVKAIEAMAAGTPIVSTTLGIESLGLAHETSALIADTAEALAVQALRLIDERRSVRGSRPRRSGSRRAISGATRSRSGSRSTAPPPWRGTRSASRERTVRDPTRSIRRASTARSSRS